MMLREAQIQKRHRRIRKKVIGSAERPRLGVHRSHLNLSIQVVDDYASKTLFSCSTLNKNFRTQVKTNTGNVDASKKFGAFTAAELKKKGITKVVFDRGGFQYHGRIKALADSLREHGIQF